MVVTPTPIWRSLSLRDGREGGRGREREGLSSHLHRREIEDMLIEIEGIDYGGVRQRGRERDRERERVKETATEGERQRETERGRGGHHAQERRST
jgi:hypothetical protein